MAELKKKLNKTFKKWTKLPLWPYGHLEFTCTINRKKMIKTSTEKPVTRKSKFTQYKWQTVHILQIAIRI